MIKNVDEADCRITNALPSIEPVRTTATPGFAPSKRASVVKVWLEHVEAEGVVAPCWYNLDLHPGNRPRLTQRRATKVNLGLNRWIGKVKWAVCLLWSEAKENSETWLLTTTEL